MLLPPPLLVAFSGWRYYSASPVITKLTLYTNFRCGARSSVRLTPTRRPASVSTPKFGIASLPRAIQCWALVLAVALSILPSLSLTPSPLSLFLSPLWHIDGVSEFRSAFKELEERYPLPYQHNYSCVLYTWNSCVTNG